jgi:hypothetical protein
MRSGRGFARKRLLCALNELKQEQLAGLEKPHFSS